jgi:hypothetical protein
MRHAWGVVDEVTGGPDEGGISSGWHFYDFYNQNPPGYNYTTDKGYLTQWGQRGGLGAVLYAGRWYCVEYEMKLNSIDVENPATPGKFWAPDGELRTWIDGRLVYERTGLVFRVGPAATWSPVGAAEMRPHRNLGIQGLWMNWYHGGVTENSYPMSMFTTGLAYGTSRIGPMKLNQAPTWAASVPVNIWTELSSMQRFGVWCQANIPYYGQYGPRAMNSIINAYCDPATDEVGQAQYYYGGGHGDGTCDAVIKCDLNTLEWSLVSSPTPPSTYPVAGVYPSGVSTVAVAGTTAAYYLTEAEGLDPVIDAGKIAPKLSRAVTHMYASAVFRGGKYYCFYSGYGECDVETGTWAPEGRYIAPPSVIGPFAWSVHDPVNDRAFVARTISGAPVDRIWEYNYSTRTFVATHSFPGGTVQYRASVTMAVKADRKIWIWVSSGPVYTTAIFNQGYIFDMDSKTFKQFTLTGADIGSTTLECTPGWWDGRKIRRINTSNFSTRDFVFSIDPNQTPVSGTGVSPTPWVLTQTSTPIPSPNNGGITYTYSRIFYHPEAECAMFIPRSGDGSTAGDASGLTSGGKYWALRLTD